MIGENQSERKLVEQGVPQGSRLGPRFNFYYVYNLPDSIKQPPENLSNINNENKDKQAEMFAYTKNPGGSKSTS